MQTKFNIYKKYLTWEKWVVLNYYANAAIFILFWKREDTHGHTQNLVLCNVWSTSCLEDESRTCISKLTNVTPPIIHIPLWNGSYIASKDGAISPRKDDIIFFEPSMTENDSRDTTGKWALHSTSCESDKVMFKNLFHDFSWQIPTAVLFQQFHF